MEITTKQRNEDCYIHIPGKLNQAELNLIENSLYPGSLLPYHISPTCVSKVVSPFKNDCPNLIQQFAILDLWKILYASIQSLCLLRPE